MPDSAPIVTPSADELIEEVLSALQRHRCWLYDLLRHHVGSASMLPLVPLLEEEPTAPGDRMRLFELFARSELDRKAIAAAIARSAESSDPALPAAARATWALVQLDPAAHDVPLRRAAEAPEHGGFRFGLEGLLRIGALGSVGRDALASDPRGVPAEYMGAWTAAGDELAIATWFSSVLGGDESCAEAETAVERLHESANVTLCDSTFLGAVIRLLDFEEKRPPGARRSDLPAFLVPTACRASRERSRFVISPSSMNELLERCEEGDGVGVFRIARELADAAIDLASRDVPAFAPLGRGLRAVLRGLAPAVERWSALELEVVEPSDAGEPTEPDRFDPSFLAAEWAVMALAKGIRATPHRFGWEERIGRGTKAELLALTRLDEDWVRTSLLERLAKRLPVSHWQRLATSSDRFVRSNARYVLAAIDPGSDIVRETLVGLRIDLDPELARRLVRLGGEATALLICVDLAMRELALRELERMDEVEGRPVDDEVFESRREQLHEGREALVDGIIDLGPTAHDVAGMLVESKDPLWEIDPYAMSLLAVATGCRAAADRFLASAFPVEAWEVLREEADPVLRHLARTADLRDEVERFRREHEEGTRSPSVEALIREAERLRVECGADDPYPAPVVPLRREGEKIGRNDPCPCGSGKKYKKCCESR